MVMIRFSKPPVFQPVDSRAQVSGQHYQIAREYIRLRGSVSTVELNAQVGNQGRKISPHQMGHICESLIEDGLIRCDGGRPVKFTWIGN